MSNTDIEDKFLRNCCYPGCLQEMLMCPIVCGYQYPLCKEHLCEGKIYLADEFLSSRINSTGMPSKFNIWYKNRFMENDYPGLVMEEQYLSLHQDNNIVRITREFSDGPTIIVLNTKDTYPSWYDSRSSNGIINKVSKEYMEIHTYKYKLYNMRLPDLYFGAIPKDILDEVIRYL